MKTSTIIIGALALFGSAVDAQQPDSFDGRPQQEETKGPAVVKKIKVWHLADNYSFADTLPNDTLLTGFQRLNPVLARNPLSLHTGNLGAPSQSMVLGDISYEQDFIFVNTLRHYFALPELYRFYNTTVPYTNITYRTGGPKRRSEENIRFVFTQNVNKKFNIGVLYNLMSSIGRYDAQKADNEMSRFWGSYDGGVYSAWGAISSNRTDQRENGGLEDESSVLHPVNNNFSTTENFAVNFSTAKNRIKNTRFFYTHALNLGNLAAKDTSGEARQSAIGTVLHTFDYDSYERTYRIDNLASYYSGGIANAYYKNIYADTIQTRDTSSYSVLRNLVQLKFNEEANVLLKFGLRVYLENELKTYRAQAQPFEYTVANKIYTPKYRHNTSHLSSTAIGGQAFKNRGDNFWWNGGVKLYMQGHRAGDSEITGSMNSRFKVWRDTAGVFASGGMYLESPGFFFDEYYSNHFAWKNNFNRQKILKLKGGIRIPTKRFEVTGETRLVNDHLYWDQNALPSQLGGVLQVVAVNLNQHFKLWGINSINQVWWQATTDAVAMPLPTLAIYSSNFYEDVLFKVLDMQLGFDLTYHSKYYAPTYMPATMQFYNQRVREIGDYPFVDLFLNFHLKRARIVFKYDHINQGYPGNDFFITQGYPNNPRSFKIAVSWNFND